MSTLASKGNFWKMRRRRGHVKHGSELLEASVAHGFAAACPALLICRDPAQKGVEEDGN